jgi:ABC-type spermidine/putrescine transport system permease subunit II
VRRRRLRRPSGLALVSLVVLAALYAPILLVLVNSVNADSLMLGWGGFTTHWYRQALGSGDVRSSLWTSVQVALLSTALSLIVAVAAALWARRARARGRRLLDATTYMRIIMPETVVAIGLFLLLRRYDVNLGVTTIVVGHVVFNSAYATIVVQARMATLSTALEEAAADLGATPWRAFRRVTLPLLAPAVLAAGLLIFSFSFDDVVTSLFLGGPDAQTLPVLLLGLIRLHVTPEVNAIGVLIILTTTALLALAAGLSSVRAAAGARVEAAAGDGGHP